MRSVVGPLPPASPRSAWGRLRNGWRGERRSRPPRRTKLSARTFALVTFVAWGAILALLDGSLGGLRHPRPFTQVLGRDHAPPTVMFPEERTTARVVPALVQSRPGEGTEELPRTARKGAAATVAAFREATLDAPQGLIVPVSGVSPDDLRDTFDEMRGGGRRHEAIDILAPRNTPVVAAADGVVDKLFTSRAGGLTIYERDASSVYDLYYAHLESYAPGIDEGDAVEQGQVIGFVGTSGNAPKETPHLHFAIFRLGPEKSWWKGEAIDPYPLLAQR